MLVRWVAIVLGAFFALLGAIRLLPVPFDQEMFADWACRCGCALARR